jgi:ABC-type antimicrobial peptide transport system permease subunit
MTTRASKLSPLRWIGLTIIALFGGTIGGIASIVLYDPEQFVPLFKNLRENCGDLIFFTIVWFRIMLDFFITYVLPALLIIGVIAILINKRQQIKSSWQAIREKQKMK